MGSIITHYWPPQLADEVTVFSLQGQIAEYFPQQLRDLKATL